MVSYTPTDLILKTLGAPFIFLFFSTSGVRSVRIVLQDEPSVGLHPIDIQAVRLAKSLALWKLEIYSQSLGKLSIGSTAVSVGSSRTA